MTPSNLVIHVSSGHKTFTPHSIHFLWDRDLHANAFAFPYQMTLFTAGALDFVTFSARYNGP